MNTLRLALRMLGRDWHAGELRVLVAALVLAVASVGTVGFFTDRVKVALTRQANLLLGGDLLLSADRPLPDDYAREARARGLAVVPAIKFNSMVQAATGAGAADAVLADVKAVAAGYPLRGVITLADPSLPEGITAAGIPRPGEAWIDGRLAARLNVGKGRELAVGDKTLTIGAIVQQEPEVAGGLLSMGPKLLMNLDDVPATKLLQPGNRAS
jgi:putative ABC transport system permease protein